MKGSILMIFGILCLINVGLSNSSPSPQYDYSDYKDYLETAADYNYEAYDLSYDIASYDIAGVDPNCQAIVCKRPRSRRCKDQHENKGCSYDRNTICDTMICGGKAGAGGKPKSSNPQNRPGLGGGNGAKKKCPPNCLRPKSQTCKSRYETNGCPYDPNDFTEMVKPVSAKPMVSRVPQKTGQGVGPQLTGDPCTNMNICKCSGKTIQGPLNLPFGHCQTKDPVSKQFFCYIEPNSACPDKQESGREVNLFFSNKACEFERACGFAAPDIEYGDDSTYTYDYDSDYESYGSY